MLHRGCALVERVQEREPVHSASPARSSSRSDELLLLGTSALQGLAALLRTVGESFHRRHHALADSPSDSTCESSALERGAGEEVRWAARNVRHLDPRAQGSSQAGVRGRAASTGSWTRWATAITPPACGSSVASTRRARWRLLHAREAGDAHLPALTVSLKDMQGNSRDDLRCRAVFAGDGELVIG
jgi:hypothetical protein